MRRSLRSARGRTEDDSAGRKCCKAGRQHLLPGTGRQTNVLVLLHRVKREEARSSQTEPRAMEVKWSDSRRVPTRWACRGRRRRRRCPCLSSSSQSSHRAKSRSERQAPPVPTATHLKWIQEQVRTGARPSKNAHRELRALPPSGHVRPDPLPPSTSFARESLGLQGSRAARVTFSRIS